VVMSRLAVVFGGSRGIGRAVSRLLAQRGHRVVLLSRNKEAAQATAESLPGGESVNTIIILNYLQWFIDENDITSV